MLFADDVVLVDDSRAGVNRKLELEAHVRVERVQTWLEWMVFRGWCSEQG
jgi:hypothetical protein